MRDEFVSGIKSLNLEAENSDKFGDFGSEDSAQALVRKSNGGVMNTHSAKHYMDIRSKKLKRYRQVVQRLDCMSDKTLWVKGAPVYDFESTSDSYAVVEHDGDFGPSEEAVKAFRDELAAVGRYMDFRSRERRAARAERRAARAKTWFGNGEAGSQS